MQFNGVPWSLSPLQCRGRHSIELHCVPYYVQLSAHQPPLAIITTRVSSPDNNARHAGNTTAEPAWNDSRRKEYAMRMLMDVRMPNNPFNDLVRDGSAGDVIGKILAEIKPEAVYFTERFGQRGVTLVLNVENPSQVPMIAEPFFLMFDAEVEFHVVMSPEELQKAGLDELGKKWA
jgi:hypothetical protein